MRDRLSIRPNLMPDEPRYQPAWQHFPGDLVDIVDPSKTESRVIERELTPVQIEEYRRYVKCTPCRLRGEAYCTH